MNERRYVLIANVVPLLVQVAAFSVMCSLLQRIGAVWTPTFFAVLLVGVFFSVGVRILENIALLRAQNRTDAWAIGLLGVGVLILGFHLMELMILADVWSFILTWALSCLLVVVIATVNDWLLPI